MFDEPVLQSIAKKYGKDVGQVILRFEHQEGIIVFPKSVHEARIKSNQEIFDFALTSDEMDAIRTLDKGKEMLLVLPKRSSTHLMYTLMTNQ